MGGARPAAPRRRVARSTRSAAARGAAAEALLTAAALIGSVCLLAAVLVTTLGIQLLVVRSGSMEPRIPVGSLALARGVDATSVRPGEVVSVVQDGRRVMHRVVSVSAPDEGGLVLKGDANEKPDPLPYRVETADRVFLSVPGVGRALAWSSTPRGCVVLGFLGGVGAAVALGAVRRRGSIAAAGSRAA